MNDTLQPKPEPAIACPQALALARPVSAGHHDELRGGLAGADLPDQLAPDWAEFFSHLDSEGLAELDRREQSVARQLRDNGVTYNVYADQDSLQRPWSVDLFPLIIPATEWAGIEAGVLQRTRLLNAILADLYGPQRLLREGLLPPALVQGHPGYLRAMHGVRPPGDTWLHVVAVDLAHGPDGRWRVVSHRTQAPSGLGYLLENRIAIGRQFPNAFNAMKAQRLGASYQALMQGLRALSPKGADARIALLTPGPYNETYFEHAYLARYLGLPLVEGNDLTVRDQRVYLKTLHGLEPIDVLIKRLGDEWLDPLELRSESALGVPGLMQAVRAGHVLLANAPGSAPLESTALQGFLPAISRRLLGEELSLPSLPTWWCGEAASLADGLHRLERSVVKRTYPRASNETEIGPLLSPKEMARLRERIRDQPDQYTLQSYLPLSQQPTWREGEIVPRAAMLRVFALCDGPRSWRVLPGGLVRMAPPGQAIASMQSGGSSADCWVRTEGEIDRTSLLSDAHNARAHAQQKRIVSSRSAENLFWLGRYTERADNSLRLARLTLRLLQGEQLNSANLLNWLGMAARHQGLLPWGTTKTAPSPRDFERALIRQLGAESGTSSVGYNLRALRLAAGQVRERLSLDLRALTERVDAQFTARQAILCADADSAPQDALDALNEASGLLTAITGEQTDRMVRDDGWRMLSIGRHIERLHTLAGALALAMDSGCLRHDDGFEAVLALFDSTITFHFQYQQRRDRIALLDVLIVNRDNPRSLGWVLSSLRSRLSKLPRAKEDGIKLKHLLPNPDDWTLDSLMDPPLLPLMRQIESAMLALSDQLAQRYFSHADRVNTSLMT
ncbi:circularly permuted type 2 ATP-grasp protein [Malikia sp.]|uniref:circularly permuted type 2 ATP-grasp protein n=1 Tax=Malikia sp. TaxID=2070706 RepID=UPI00261B469C|nr:circularly permuted type 2 ATP-grasp protein [Malikia sp.]MDD2729895.1 circularly permuted type 2 ATP-grasp protein [Malikia sp.]